MRCPHFQYVCGWYQEGDQPFSQEFDHSCLKLWEDFLDGLERCFDVWDVCCRGYSYCSSGIFVSNVESAQCGKNSKQQKKHLAAAQKHLCSRKNAFWRQREKTVRGGKKPVRGKKKTGRGRKKTSSRESPALQPKKLPQRKKYISATGKSSSPNIEVCANASGNMSKHQPARKRLKKSTLAASTLTCCVFICTNLEQTRNTRPIGHFTMAGTLQVAKLWHAGFSYAQTSSKPCSNLKSMGPDDASRCDRILKESSINFFFCARQL